MGVGPRHRDPAALQRLRTRITDKRVIGLVKAYLKAGILTELGGQEDTLAGTPQGGILSPLIANIALSALDEHFAQAWQSTMATRPAREAIRRRYRFLSYGVYLERFRRGQWYRLPPRAALELRTLSKGLQPLRLTRAAIAKSR